MAIGRAAAVYILCHGITAVHSAAVPGLLFWKGQDIIFDFRAQLYGTGSRSVIRIE